jgi:uncharacterized repeat protein (TIGR04138 family)
MSDFDTDSLAELERQRQAFHEAANREPHYHVDGYIFVCEAVQFTCQRQGRRRHVSGQELLDGLCELALEQFGYLADAVLAAWGITTTDDIGEMVFTLIDVGLLSRREEDSKDDFRNVFDLHHTLRERYQVTWTDEDDA